MNDRERAIVMAYTGVCMLTGDRLNEFYKYLAELYGRPVYTHEIAALDISDRAKNDFLELCKEPAPSAEKTGKWEPYLKQGLTVKCSVCGSRYAEPWHYCPNCGARMIQTNE